MLHACLNGARRRDEHAALPCSPDELARDAAACVAAGAVALHVHPRDRDGNEALDHDTIAAALAAIRAACPTIAVGVTTGAWIERDVERRHALIASWRARPDFASVNLSEPGAIELCRLLLEREISIEAGIWSVADVERLVAADLQSRILRVLVEPMETTLPAARANITAIESALDAAGVTAPRLVHGQDATAWPILVASALRGRDVRIGLEDVLELPYGVPARDNAELVATAARLIQR